MGVLNLLFMLNFNGTVKPLIQREVTTFRFFIINFLNNTTTITIIDNAYIAENANFLCNQEKVTLHLFKEETYLLDEYFDFLEMEAAEQSAVIAGVSVKYPCC